MNKNNKKTNIKDLKPRGEAHYNHVLTEKDVKGIRSMRKEGYSFGYIGREFNISPQHAQDIVSYRTWKHI